MYCTPEDVQLYYPSATHELVLAEGNVPGIPYVTPASAKAAQRREEFCAKLRVACSMPDCAKQVAFLRSAYPDVQL